MSAVASAAGPLAANLFIVKEHVGLFKAANNYDIYDPETGRLVMECREEGLGIITKLLRFTDYKRMTPFDVRVRLPGGPTLVRVKRGVTLFFSKVTAFDEHDRAIGQFQQKFTVIRGKFTIATPDGRPLCALVGDWKAWNFRFMDGDTELAQVAKKWSGIGRELFTSADTYALRISPSVPAASEARRLILAAVMCIDMVLKE